MEPGLRLPSNNGYYPPGPPRRQANPLLVPLVIVLILALAVGVGVALFLIKDRHSAASPSTTMSVSQTPSTSQPTSDPTSQSTVTVTQSDAISTSTVTQQAAPTVITSLRTGSWVAIMESLAKSDTSSSTALAEAAKLDGGSGALAVLDSSTIPNLHPGYWAIAQVGLTSEAEAASSCRSFGRTVGSSCSLRQIG